MLLGPNKTEDLEIGIFLYPFPNSLHDTLCTPCVCSLLHLKGGLTNDFLLSYPLNLSFFLSFFLSFSLSLLLPERQSFRLRTETRIASYNMMSTSQRCLQGQPLVCNPPAACYSHESFIDCYLQSAKARRMHEEKGYIHLLCIPGRQLRK